MAGAVRISPDDLVDVLAKIAKDDNLQVSVKQSVKGGVIAGTGATVGGLLGGPIGIAVGATLGKYILCLTKYIFGEEATFEVFRASTCTIKI